MLTDPELLELLHDPESDRAERKASASDLGEIRKDICAFANDLPNHRRPGVIFVGWHDDGRCAGLDVSDELLLRLAHIRDDGKTQPFPSMAVQRRTFDGCTLAVVEVEPSDNPPVRVDGRIWIRIGPRKGTATGDDERRLVEKRRWGNLPFDQQGFAGASLADLDLARFQLEYLPAFIPADVLDVNDRSQEDQLKALRLLTPDGLPTVAALLLIGKDTRHWLSGAYVQFLRLVGREITDEVRDQKEIGGTLLDQLRQLDEVLTINIDVALDLTSNRDVPLPSYPLGALQELARNALVHRNYEGSTAPVRLTWYSDRVEITSPGGPFGEVTAANFGQPYATSYRNPALAEAAKQMSYVQRFGTGIARARKLLADNGNPAPTFRVEPSFVAWTVHAKL